MNSLSKLWNWISYIGITDTSRSFSNRRIILCNQLAAFTIADTLLLEILFIGFGIYSLLLTHTLFVVVYFLVLYLNKAGYYRFAKNLLLFAVVSEVFIVSLQVGNETGFFLYYFPIVCAGLILYDFEERKKAFLIIGLSVLCTILLHLPAYNNILIAVHLSDTIRQTIFITILATAVFITGLCVYHLMQANAIVEKNLQHACHTVENLNKELIASEEELTANLEHLSLLSKEINSEKAKLSAIVESANHLIWSVDTNYKLIYCNSTYRTTFQKSYGVELQPGDISIKYLSEDSFAKWKMWFDKALSGVKFSVEHTGKTCIWEVFFNPIIEGNNKVIGVTVFMQNISARKKAEKELIAAKELAEQASKAKAQFLSTMSHEIRTPMNAVIGMTHLLLEEDPKPDQKENLDILKFSAQNLLALINDILDFSKIDAGKIEFEEVEFNIRELIDSIRQTLALKANENGLRLEAVLDEAMPYFVTGDPVRLNQIITNLLSNAVKFTPEGSILIEACLQAKTADTVTIHFAVKDTGIGIPEDKIEKIFDSFTQASSETTRKFGGTGLGLAITKRLLELQNSRIHVQSRVGVGSTFHFALTFKRSNKEVAAKEKVSIKNSASETTQHLEGAKILLVEDNPVNQLIACKFLSKWGVRIDIADNGLIAVAQVKVNDYDLVLMDLEMPEMDGYAATRTIRSLAGDQYKFLPIVALTASALSEVEDLVMAAGMNGYITKPFNPNEMFEVLNNNLLKRTV